MLSSFLAEIYESSWDSTTKARVVSDFEYQLESLN